MFNGTNLAGGEIDWTGSNSPNPVSGTDYMFVTHQDIDYLVSKNMNSFRLLFSWEVMQPSPNGPLSANNYATEFWDRVNYITNIKGAYCLIEPHGGSSPNFARYKGNVVGSSAVPNSAFADFWAKMAAHVANNPKVFIGLSNEPNDMGTLNWFAAAQAAITAIRNVGFTNYIFVPGNGWTGAGSWLDNWYDTSSTKVSNATAWKTLNDPLNGLVATIHNYADSNAGGGDTSIVSASILVDRLTSIVNWAKTNKVRIHMSEFAVAASNSLAQSTVNNVVNYMNSNSDVFIGAYWWAAGFPSWWGSYQFTLCPTNNYTVDSPQMNLLKNCGGFLVAAPTPAPTPTPTPTPTPSPTPIVNMKPTTTTVKAPGDQGFTSSKVVGSGYTVTAGTYYLKAATRTTYGDNTSAVVDIILSNDNTAYDIDWDLITIDMRGHVIQNFWNCTITGTTGIVTVSPVTATKTVRAMNKNAFGFSFTRNTDPAKASYQVLVTSIKW